MDEREFPSPRGVELHKPRIMVTSVVSRNSGRFPSPRGVELHKPPLCRMQGSALAHCFRPLAGLSCINPYQDRSNSRRKGRVSVPSRG